MQKCRDFQMRKPIIKVPTSILSQSSQLRGMGNRNLPPSLTRGTKKILISLKHKY
jgi:hypothetical protein